MRLDPSPDWWEESLVAKMRVILGDGIARFLRSRRTPAEVKLADLYDQMANRQGTVMPDFAALYRQREALERRCDEAG